MPELPPNFPDETTPPEDQPLLLAEALAENSGLPISEFNGLTLEQLNALFDDPEVNEHLHADPSKTEEIKKKNTEILRKRIGEMRSAS